MFLSEEMQDNAEVVLLAVQQCGGALQFASEEKRASGTIVEAAINQDSSSVQHAIGYNDCERFFKVDQDGVVLQYASGRIRALKSVALRAVSSNWRALEFVTPSLKDDEDVVRQALRHGCSTAVKFVGKKLRNQEWLFYEAGWRALKYASSAIRDNVRVVGYCYRQDPRALEWASLRLRQMNPFLLAKRTARHAQSLG
jgi:hypothetical protein